jgi:hypothetical protein
MAFFQNVFNTEFRGNWVLGDRQYSLTFACPPNLNSSNYQLAYNNGPWDLSGSAILTLNYAWDESFKNYAALEINVEGDDSSATTPEEVSSALNSNPTFADMFFASVKENVNGNTVLITQKVNRIKKDVRLWISNTGAEAVMGFNLKAGVSELPSYFARHTIENRFNYSDSVGQLILLDEEDNTDQIYIENAGFSVGDMKEDWELIKGRASGLFTFQKITVDGNDRITEIIEYPAGAEAGDLARKINYSYTSTNTNPNKVTEIPYVLTDVDLVNP